MTNREREKVLNFMDRGTWQHTLHMKRDRENNVDMRHPDNIELIRGNIEGARQEAKMLMLKADAVERIMDRYNNPKEE